MPYLVTVNLLWAFSFSLIGEYLAGRVDSDFAVLVRVAIAALVFVPIMRWRGLPGRLVGGLWLAGALQFGVTYLCLYRSFAVLTVPEVLLFTVLTPIYVTLLDDALARRFNPWALLAALVAVAGGVAIRFQPLEGDYLMGFLLLQLIVLGTTLVLNILMYFGQSFSFAGLSWETVFSRAGMNLSFGMLLGAFCFRYLYLREQWSRQQNSELNARIQAMQARIHPHFLFNSLNTLISEIEYNPMNAIEFTRNLADTYRYILYCQDKHTIPLREELDFLIRV